MKKRLFSSLFLALILAISALVPAAVASDVTDDPVQAVINQLEAIDTLQQMQDKRNSYKGSGTSDLGSPTNASHEEARAGYEAYVAEMFSARLAAQQAYDNLTSAQQEQISSSLVAKLDNGPLDTIFKGGTYSVSPSSNEYAFEAVDIGYGAAYEVALSMISGQIPQTFILVDTSDGKTSWTPDGLYSRGNSNYDVVYCCDVETGLKYSSHYKRLNLEDSSYYGPNAAAHIRAILENSYPFISLSEMKSRLRSGGLRSSFVDTLTRGDIIAAVQAAVWSYANANDTDAAMQYFASIDVTRNTGLYFTPLHDYTNECWDWLAGERSRTFDKRAQYRVNTLTAYLISLSPVAPISDDIVISDVKVTRAELLPRSDDTYRVGMYVYLNDGGSKGDSVKVTVDSGTGRNAQMVNGRKKIEMVVNAKPGDTIKVTVEGTQHVSKGVYFYEPEGGRHASQCLVGVASGETPVYAKTTFEFGEEIEKGLLIYKTERGTGLPIEDITFTIYKVPEGGTTSPTPTDEEIAAYATSENKVASLTTDETGYAALTLEDGYYLIVEEHNSDKIKAPVHPFYISIPLTVTTENEDGSVTVETIEAVSVYPKNEPVTPPEEPPVTPPIPDTVKGALQVIKHSAGDSSHRLPGAQFQLYRAATEDDSNTEIITCDGVEYAVVPVSTLTTGQDGTATKGDLPCGLYFLKEITAPAGYNLLDEAVSVTIVSTEISEITTVKIANEPGFALPETGGEGTMRILMLGGMLTLAAGALLIGRKRMRAF